MKIYQALAQLVQARENCVESGNVWKARHEEEIEKILKGRMPSGSGFDNGTSIDLEKSNHNKLVFETKFHHMDSDGYYVKWTSHVVTVRPSLAFGMELKVSGPNLNQIKDHIVEVFDLALTEEDRNA